MIIRKIFIEGNLRTRHNIILRELTFKEGDTMDLDLMMQQFVESQNQLQNTGLFNEVLLNIQNWKNDSTDVLVTVKERWYTIPLPALNLYDRNFNVWWVDHDHDIRWLQIGARLYQKNLTGRNDELKAELLFGFQQRFSLQYNLPYFDRIQKHGFSLSSSYVQSKNFAYDVEGNKEAVFVDLTSYQRKAFSASIDLFYRPRFHYKYILSFGYRYNSITDTIAQLNPDYFLNGNTVQRYLYSNFIFSRDYRNIIAYPLTGNYLEAYISKLGFGLFDDVDYWQIIATYNQYLHLGRKWYLSSLNKVKISFPELQPYNMERGLGYGGDYVSGYEYYAIDGQSFGYAKLNLKNELLSFKIKSKENNPFTSGANLPISLFAKTFVDAGYVKDEVYSENNPLTNQFLVGGGIGLDLVLIYDTSLRIEYSINRLGEHAFFYHFSAYF